MMFMGLTNMAFIVPGCLIHQVKDTVVGPVKTSTAALVQDIIPIIHLTM